MSRNTPRRVPGDLRKIIALLEEYEHAGWAYRWTSRGHLRVTLHGQAVAGSAGTASDWRSHQNFVGQLRRAGLPVPHKKKEK